MFCYKGEKLDKHVDNDLHFLSLKVNCKGNLQVALKDICVKASKAVCVK